MPVHAAPPQVDALCANNRACDVFRHLQGGC